MKAITHCLKKCCLLILMLAAMCAACGDAEPVLALGGLDPVALTRGKEAKGKEELQATQGRYRYLFASKENKQKFDAAPESFAIRFDGACMKMGPLSGYGGPERYYVHDGRIYLFASESCRDRFKAEPEKFIDRPDEPPSGTEAERKRGRELLEHALSGLGGADKVDGLKTLRAEMKLTYQQRDQLLEGKQVMTMSFPERWRVEESWGGPAYGHALSPDRAVNISKGEFEPASKDVWEVVVCRYYHNVLPILRARGEKGFVAVAGGPGQVDGVDVEWVKTGFKGATTSLGIDAKSGRILQLAYQGRTPAGIGEVRKTFSEFRPVEGGLMLPFKVQTAYNGKAEPKPATYVTLELNRVLSPTEFPAAK